MMPSKRDLGKLFPISKLNTHKFQFGKTGSVRMGANFWVNNKMNNPVLCTKLGNDLSKKLKKYIKSSKLANSLIDYIPTFEYGIRSFTENRNLPDKICIKLPFKKNSTSYILWKKGVIVIKEGISTLLIAHMVRFLYLMIRKDHPYLLKRMASRAKKLSQALDTLDKRQEKGEELLKKMIVKGLS